MLNVRPLTSRIARRVRRKSLIHDAFASLEISPGTDWSAPAPIHLPGEEERILRMVENHKAEDDLARSKRPIVSQGPTRAHCIRDAVIANGMVMTKTSFEDLRPRTGSFMLSGEVEQFGERTLCSTWITEQYWGHWLKDVFCHELLARQLGAEPLVLSNRNRLHEDGYRALVEMPANVINVAHVEKLWILEDHEINAGRVDRLKRIGAKLRGIHVSTGPSHVYIKRGDTGVGRRLVNESEIVEALEARGFTILAPEEMEANDLVASLRSARLVVGVEGSAMSHATVTMPGGGGQLMIQPPQRFNMLARTFCAALGHLLGYTVADPANGDSFFQPVDRLIRVVDMMEDALYRQPGRLANA